jgi:glycine hydroxymethyltransferase
VAADRGYTASHTILLATANLGEAEGLGRRLEEANVIVTSIRLPEKLGGSGLRVGVAEVTRRGADEALMDEIAQILSDVLLSRQTTNQVRAQVETLTTEHLQDFRFSGQDLL